MIENPPMKKVIPLNGLAVFALFNVCVLLISCTKKKAEEIEEAGASPSKPSLEAPAKSTKFTADMVVAAFEKAADRMPSDLKAKMMKEMPLKDPAKMAEMTERLNAELANGKMELREISVDALTDYIVVEMPKARALPNRIKCVHNLGQVYKSMLSFAQDNGERLPWQLTPSGVRAHLDAAANPGAGYGRQKDAGSNILNHHPKTGTVGGVFGMVAVKVELQTPKILLSPCDPGRKAANELIQKNWESYDAKAGKLVPHNGLSYGLCLGADTQRPAAVLATTRNLSTDDLATAKWIGGEDKMRGMLGLKISQGQMVQMDGSRRASFNGDIGAEGKVVKGARSNLGGVAKGKTSTKMMLPYDTE